MDELGVDAAPELSKIQYPGDSSISAAINFTLSSEKMKAFLALAIDEELKREACPQVFIATFEKNHCSESLSARKCLQLKQRQLSYNGRSFWGRGSSSIRSTPLSFHSHQPRFVTKHGKQGCSKSHKVSNSKKILFSAVLNKGPLVST